MICALTSCLLELYCDSRLVAFQARWVKAHLAVCPACAAELAAAQKLTGELRAIAAPLAPAFLRNKLRAALLEKPVVPASKAASLYNLMPELAPTLSFAYSALAFLVFVSGSLLSPGIPCQAYPADAVAVTEPVPHH